MKHCIFSALGVANADNDGANSININFTVKDTKLHVSLVTLSAEDNQKLPKLLREGFESSVYWNEYKTKSETKNMTDEWRYFLNKLCKS